MKRVLQKAFFVAGIIFVLGAAGASDTGAFTLSQTILHILIAVIFFTASKICKELS